jgi:O-antigen ligase
MSAWPGALDGLAGRRPFAVVGGGGVSRGGLDARLLAGLLILAGLLVGEGMALAHSYLWAAPLAALLLIAAAVDLPLVPLLGLVLFTRVLTDSAASETSRHSAALNPSAAIAAVLILVAIGLLVYRRRGLVAALAIALGLGVWMAVAVHSQGASAVTVREGVRELSIAAVAVIAYNARRALDLPTVVRIVQVAGIVAALLAIFQLATHSGVSVGGDMRSNGTFAHPNDAAVFFAIAATASLWRFSDAGRRRLDLALAATFALAALSTFSIDGFLTLLVMIAAFGMLRPGSRRLKVRAAVLVGALALAFLATPAGSQRLSSESSAEAGAHSRHGSGSSLSWRFYKWETLIPEWERSPYLGKGLGTTVTAEATAQSTTAGNLPHSEYVRYLVETGIVGFVAVAAGVAMLIRRLNRGRRLATTRSAAILALALIAGLLVNALAANTLLYTPAAYAAALIVGVSLRTVNAGRAPKRDRARALAAR